MRLTKQLFTTDLSPGWKGLYSPFGHKVAFIEKSDWDFEILSEMNNEPEV